MPFKPDFTPPAAKPESALWFIFDKGRLLVRMNNDSCSVPDTSDLARYTLVIRHEQYLGALDERPCYAAEYAGDPLRDAELTFKDLRWLFGKLKEDLIWIAGRANQLVNWSQTHRHCGRCGKLTEDKTDERAKACPDCGLINYPRLSPAVIVAVLKDDRILLGRNKRFKLPFYSVLAGFVEPGETLEECVKREIREEVAITVKNIRYFGSQPWPFPNSLMVGFTADWDGGDIDVNQSEIVEAAWYTADDLPRIPPRITIARWLIDWFRDSC